MMNLADIAMLEEGRLCNALEIIAPESRRLAGGVLTRGEPGTWINTTSGLGMGVGQTTPVTAADIEALVAWFEEKAGSHTTYTMAILFGLSVLPEYRKRGIQQAMIGERLRIARQEGAHFATISARPGVATERNARRMGFEVAYTKAIVVRPGAGLRPND